ncbi:hypothetical protein NE865_12605 [Phthorimaea operculella]|nr:hypothetical protein NE865_12605 [Phthorimaea operculella]
MTTSGSGAVFFLGTRAHYQVLQQPESRFDADNGNASTETIYQNPSVDSTDYTNLAYIDSEANVIEEKEKEPNGMKRRQKRRQSEVTLCEKDIEIKPALLNNIGESETPKSKSSKRRVNLLNFLASLYKRKKRLDADQIQYLQHIESVLQTCTYRECCRCLDCQSRYFDVDESDYSSDEETDYNADYSAYYVTPTPQPEEDDDEVFVDTARPGDTTSTDLLIEDQEPARQMSVSSDEDQEQALDIEVAAGTPVLLNYLLTHPITCCIQ